MAKVKKDISFSRIFYAHQIIFVGHFFKLKRDVKRQIKQYYFLITAMDVL